MVIILIMMVLLSSMNFCFSMENKDWSLSNSEKLKAQYLNKNIICKNKFKLETIGEIINRLILRARDF